MNRSRVPSITATALCALGLAGCLDFGVDHSGNPHGVPYDTPGTEPLPEGEVVGLDPAPPPISGGTMIVTRDLGLAVAADPDRDRVWVVEPKTPAGGGRLIAEIALTAGDEPGRVIEGAGGRIHVALRGAGAVATIELASGEVVERRPVCAAPRGLAYDAASDAIHVACARGELVTFPAAGGPEIRRLQLEEDLRDVVVDGARLLVSRFRSAEVLILDAAGVVIDRSRPPEDVCAPSVAWRMAPLPGGGAVVVHQMAQLGPVTTSEPGGYGSGSPCGDGIVTTAVSLLPPEGADPGPVVTNVSGNISMTAVPVDVAVSADRRKIAVVGAGSGSWTELSGGTLGSDAWSSPYADTSALSLCWLGEDLAGLCQPIAAAYDAGGNLLIQSREPPMLAGVPLPGESRGDTGHALFHQSPNGTIACASCHPEGREDGHVWFFEGDGLRRTQSLAGGVLETAPFHWDGSLPDLGALMEVVFTGRMGGMSLGPKRLEALGGWIETIPAEPARAPGDPDAAARGAEIFADPAVGCATCHSGPALTNGTTVAVGTGRAFQVPRLTGLAARAPYLHDGCAATLLDRFGPCGGGDQHGVTSHLTEQELHDLVAFLETL